jgi:hypothetical protein
MAKTTKEDEIAKLNAELAKLAQQAVNIYKRKGSGRPLSPTAWRHRALSELGRMGGKASAKSLTPQQRTERARKAGKARQAKARKAAKKGGGK